MSVKRFSQWVCTIGLPILLASSAHARIVEWDATMGLLPEQVNPPWALVDSAEPEAPALASTYITLSTSASSERMYYIHSGDEVSIPDTLTIEARMRLVSGVGASFPARPPAHVCFTLSPSYGNCLAIDIDEIYLHSGPALKGSSALVDTDGDFHTYVIEIDGRGNISTSYDGVPTLTGVAFTFEDFNGLVPRVSWGTHSIQSHGVSEWEYVRHNAGPEHVPALGLGGLALLVSALGSCGFVFSRAAHRSDRT
jgi:hypothetical protein